MGSIYGYKAKSIEEDIGILIGTIAMSACIALCGTLCYTICGLLCRYGCDECTICGNRISDIYSNTCYYIWCCCFCKKCCDENGTESNSQTNNSRASAPVVTSITTSAQQEMPSRDEEAMAVPLSTPTLITIAPVASVPPSNTTSVASVAAPSNTASVASVEPPTDKASVASVAPSAPATVAVTPVVKPASRFLFERPPVPSSVKIFNKLGYRLHRDFLAGNLTDELKTAMSDFSEEELQVFEVYAMGHNKYHIYLFIRSIIDIRHLSTSPAPDENV